MSSQALRTAAGSIERSHLWDGWIVFEVATDTYHRFILAAPKEASLDGPPGGMAERDARAYIRYFSSQDGVVWQDHGSTGIEGWSGSAIAGSRGRFLFYTERSIARQRVRMATWHSGDFLPRERPILDPMADPDSARRLGYHLEDGDGYVMAWRDPHVYASADGTHHMLFAAKRTQPGGTVVPAVGHATTGDLKLGRWTLQAPLGRLEDESGEHLAGQIELPVVASRGGQRYLFLSHSIESGGRWIRRTRAYLFEGAGLSGRLVPVDGRGGVILEPEQKIYGFNVLPDPKRPGELLAHAFYDRGHPRQMQPTPMIRLEFRGDLPVAEFDGAWQYRAQR